jgi:hypothetical protein
MNPKQLSVGMRVVVVDEPDAHVYTIAQIDGFNVKLVYPLKSGKIVDGGVCDASYIKRIVS